MSDTPMAPISDPGDGSTTPATGEEEEEQKQPDWEAEARKWKVLARKHEQRAKANEEAAKRLREAEEADQTALQKVTAKAEEAERRAAEAELRALRLEVAAAKGLTPTLAKRLVGSTREELEEDAAELLASVATPEAKPSALPKERLRGGSDPTEEPDETDPRKLAAGISLY